MSDNLEAGLDITGFSQEKLARLREFVAVFEKLEKYHGKSFQPVNGGGTTEFNKSLKETNDLLTEISTKIGTLQAGYGTIDKAKLSSTAKTASHTAAVTANTNAIVRNTAANNANASSIEKIGKGLTNTLSIFRYAAYILPGIGLAGLLGGFVAVIGKAIDKLTDFNYALRENQKIETEANANLLKQISNYETLYNAKKKLYDLDNQQSEKNLKNIQAISKAAGTNPVSLSGADVDVSKVGLEELKKRVDEKGGLDQIAAVTKIRISEYKDLQKQMTALEEVDNLEKAPRAALMLSKKNSFIDPFNLGLPQALSDAGGKREVLTKMAGQQIAADKNKSLEQLRKEFPTSSFTPVVTFSPEQMTAAKESIKAKMELTKKDIEDNEALYETFTNKKLELDKNYSANRKLIDDEARKKFVQETIDEQNAIIAKNKIIVKSETSKDNEVFEAQKAIEIARTKITGANLYNVLKNSSSTSADKSISNTRAKNELGLIDKESYDEYISTIEKFYQRDLKALTDTEINKQDAIAISNRKIYTNINKSLEERLEAYKNYIKALDNIDDLIYKRDSDVLGLSNPQKENLKSERDRRKSNNKANSEEEIYNIVYSEGEEELKAIIDTNILQDQENRKQYAKELDDLNASFANKLISYRSFLGKTKDLKNKYKISQEESDIINDSQELERLGNFIKDHESKRDEYAGAANSETDTKKKGDLQAKFKAEVDTIANAEIEKQIVRDRLGKNMADKAEAVRIKELNAQKLLEQTKLKIREKAFDLTKKLIDQEAESELEKIAKIREAQDEAFENQRDAVERSSLDAKNKTALEIQLGEQKREFDIQTELGERKIKHDNAVADKELALTEAIINGHGAVVKTLEEYGGTPAGIAAAWAVGILSALQVAEIALTQIPAYEFGTQGVGHKGGPARVGEKGKKELVLEPYKTPYLIEKDGIYNLPVNTQVFPVADMQVAETIAPDGMEPFIWLAGQLKSKNQKTTIKNNIVINIDQSYRKRILG